MKNDYSPAHVSVTVPGVSGRILDGHFRTVTADQYTIGQDKSGAFGVNHCSQGILHRLSCRAVYNLKYLAKLTTKRFLTSPACQGFRGSIQFCNLAERVSG